MKVVVTGSRKWLARIPISDALKKLQKKDPDLLVIEGGCLSGADKIARLVCEVEGIDNVTVHANWKRFKAYGGPRRNRLMLDYQPDRVLAFGLSMSAGGTIDCVEEAERRGIPVDKFEAAGT